MLVPRRRNVHRVRRSFVLRLLWYSDGHQSSVWRIHMTVNFLVHQFLSTAAFCFQAIQFEGLRCFQLKDGSSSDQKPPYTKSHDIHSGMCVLHMWHTPFSDVDKALQSRTPASIAPETLPGTDLHWLHKMEAALGNKEKKKAI